MATKRTAAILTIVGGVFYILGGAVVAALFDLLGSGFGSGSSGVGDLFGCGSLCGNSTSFDGYSLGGGLDLGGLADALLVFGLISGAVIIFGGWLINSENSGRRKVGCILALVMIIIGGIATLGGLLIGFVLAAIGVYFGFTYRSNSRGLVIPLGPMASVTLGPQTIPAASQVNTPAGTGPLNYCTKCGSQIRPGSVFCGACGARLTD